MPNILLRTAPLTALPEAQKTDPEAPPQVVVLTSQGAARSALDTVPPASAGQRAAEVLQLGIDQFEQCGRADRKTLDAREGGAVIRAFGIAPLKDETSRSASVGMVLRPVSHFSVTADLCRTDIIDRIVFSSTVALNAALSA